MTSKTFKPGTVIDSDWLNDVNDTTYTALQLTDYTALRAYTGARKSVYVIAPGIAGMFVRDDSDTTTADNGGTVIVVGNGKRWRRTFSGAVDVSWFGASPSASAATNTSAFTAAASASNHIRIPAGRFELNTLALSDVKGVTIEGVGAALVSSGVAYSSNTVLSFDTAAPGTDGLTINTFVGVVLKNFVISHRHANAGGGRALFLGSGHDFSIENVKVDSYTGALGKGISLGGGTAATSAFLGRLANCKVISGGGASFETNATNTSTTFESCYQIGGYFSLAGLTYSTLINCASESAPLYGYLLNGVSNVSFVSCGGEANGRGVFYLQSGCNNLTFLNPKGVINNQSNIGGFGDLVMLDSSAGANYAITIINPTSQTSNTNTTAAIYANASTGKVEIYGVSNSNLLKGIDGDPTWKLNSLTQTGDSETGNVTSLVSYNGGFTFVGTPVTTATYSKKGSLVYFCIKITPGTSGSINVAAAAQITIPWNVPFSGTATVVDDNVTSYGVALITGNKIYMPSTGGAKTVALYISGSFTI